MPHTQAFFSAVECLTVKLHHHETPGDTLHLLPVVQETLLGLSLNATRYPYRSRAPIVASLDLSSFVKLRHLILINWPRNPEQPQFAFPESLLSTFSASSSVLESVALTITWDRWDLDADWDEDGSWRRAQGLVIDPQGKRRSSFATLKS
ncbi:hypothetical protein FA13DRAFT_1108893 [Coprinellus micaceus]|uniref:Uncharacterized protein n=1 Tax=Coprinellus micaceus TaxID=71717 RepID=A0A4Y7SVY4_COPMI|nr:hypothetical protein FA13DRAFT_1108893 [Coprinellus micaceus]